MHFRHCLSARAFLWRSRAHGRSVLPTVTSHVLSAPPTSYGTVGFPLELGSLCTVYREPCCEPQSVTSGPSSVSACPQAPRPPEPSLLPFSSPRHSLVLCQTSQVPARRGPYRSPTKASASAWERREPAIPQMRQKSAVPATKPERFLSCDEALSHAPFRRFPLSISGRPETHP